MFYTVCTQLRRWFSQKLEPSTVADEVPVFARESDAIQPLSDAGRPIDNAIQRQSNEELDIALLERTRTLWSQGKWDSIVRGEINSIENHPARAELSLIVCSAWLQLGDGIKARSYLQQATDWGYEKKLATQVLIIGVHNSLGRIASLAGDTKRVGKHLHATAVGSDRYVQENEISLRNRSHVELYSLGLAWPSEMKNGPDENQSQTESHITLNLHNLNNLNEQEESVLLHIDESQIAEQEERIPLEDLINKQFDVARHLQTKNVLIILSSPRSGSTLLSDVLKNNDACIPHEYFQPYQYLPLLAKRWECIRHGEIMIQKYVNSLCRYRTTNDGWLGINLHGSHIPVFMPFKNKFNGARFHYIHLIRKNIVGQAISLAIAKKTGKWSCFFRGNATAHSPKCTIEEIEVARKEIESENLSIQLFVSGEGIECKQIYYEDMISNWGESIKELGELLNMKASLEFKTNLQEQRTAQNKHYQDLYYEELLKNSGKSFGVIEIANKLK